MMLIHRTIIVNPVSVVTDVLRSATGNPEYSVSIT
jgi:hypothetical protein